jgi:hypothetical protein
MTVVKKDGIKEKKSVTKRHFEEREKFIKQMGKDKFDSLAETSEKFARLKDLPFPTRYSWIWGHFLAIWGQCETDMMGNRIFTYGTINDYVECMKVPLSVFDKRILLKMKLWANEQIYEMKEKDK